MNQRARTNLRLSWRHTAAGRACWLLVLLAAWVLPVGAQHESHGAQAAAAKPAETAVALSIPDVEVLDQNGRRIRFYSDLVKGRVVAINFIFTTCTTICPVLGANFARVEEMLQDRPGRDFRLISVSIDPATDTPERLRSWAGKFGRRNGWTLVTGAKAEMDRLIKALQSYSPAKEEHTPIVWIGDDARNRWTRANGLGSPATLAQILRGYLEAAHPEHPSGEKKP